VIIHIKEGQTETFEKMMEDNDVPYSIAIHDLEPLLKLEKVQSRAGGFDASYHDLSQVIRKSMITSENGRDGFLTHFLSVIYSFI
jgi:hypothetical protein